MSKVDGFNAYQNSFFNAAMKDMPGFKGGSDNRVDRKNDKVDPSKAEKSDDKMAVSAKKTSETTGSVELSDKAKALLDELKQKYGNVDFMVANYSSDEEAQEILSRGTKEFGVLIEPELLEEMANDEEVKNKYIGIIEDSTQKLSDMKEELAAAGEENGSEVKSIGVSIASDGTVSFFAELKKSSDAQKARIEENREKRQEERAEEKKRAEREARDERIKGGPDRYARPDEDDAVKSTTVKANSLEELLEQIKNVDWNSVAAKAPAREGSRFDFSV